MPLLFWPILNVRTRRVSVIWRIGSFVQHLARDCRVIEAERKSNVNRSRFCSVSIPPAVRRRALCDDRDDSRFYDQRRFRFIVERPQPYSGFLLRQPEHLNARVAEPYRPCLTGVPYRSFFALLERFAIV
jgi:hypothetical protein